MKFSTSSSLTGRRISASSTKVGPLRRPVADFFADFIVLCLQHIYKEDYEPNRTRLMQEFGIDSTKVGSLITTPRRWGKTTSVAMFIAAMMMVCEGLTIATFAPGQRASTGLKTKVLEKMCELPDKYQSRILPDSKELCSVIVPSMMDSNGQVGRPLRRALAIHSCVNSREARSRTLSRPRKSIACLPILARPTEVRCRATA